MAKYGPHPKGCTCGVHTKRSPESTQAQKIAFSEKMRAINSRAERRETSKKAALDRLSWEKREADKLEADGYSVYVPSWVCDRIAVKDGKVFLVEFKQPGQSLQPKQQEVRDAEPDRYLITYSRMKE